MAAAAKTQTTTVTDVQQQTTAQQRIQAWRQTALALAVQAHLDGTARFAGLSGRTTSNWLVPSRDRSGRYTVVCNERTGALRCHCAASNYGKPCAHVGAVVSALRQRQQAMAAAGQQFEAMRYWAHGGEW